MLLNVTDGSAHPEISCTAHSHTPHVDVEPQLLDLGASLPVAEGGAELQGTLTLHNPHNHAIEVGNGYIPRSSLVFSANTGPLFFAHANAGIPFVGHMMNSIPPQGRHLMRPYPTRA